ncbi:hypothetical protein [Zoogloea sp.]|uniref:hypothetical protein n=1 Tax=Zoogloea sp. TaxID=49181 RepID=UPI0035B1F23B
MMGAIYGPDGLFTGGLVAGSDESLMLRLVPEGMSVWRYDAAPPDPQRWRVEAGELVEYQPPRPADTELVVWSWDAEAWRWASSPTPKAVRAAAAEQIDVAAGRARARYITSVPGQDATYTAKYAEAQAYAAAGYPDCVAGFPYIAGESRPEANRSAREAADRIIAVGDQWNLVIGPQIEATRVNGKDRVSRLNRPAEVVAAMEEVVAALDAI